MIRRCLRADRNAWDEFFRRYSRLIYSAIYGILDTYGRSRQTDFVDEIFQDLIVALIKDNCRRLRSFKALNGCSLASWLRQVTIHFTISSLRKSLPEARPDEQDSGEEEALEPLDDEAFAGMDRGERLKHLADCIDKLENEDKYFLELYCRAGLSLDDIRQHLRINRGAVDMRKTRIVQRLKDCFRSKGLALDS